MQRRKRVGTCEIENGVTFRYKDYRRDGADRQRTMTLSPDEFIRRFLLHVLPKGFHRIRHYGLLASTGRQANVARARELLAAPTSAEVKKTAQPPDPHPSCPCCGGRMVIIEIFQRAPRARAPPNAAVIRRYTETRYGAKSWHVDRRVAVRIEATTQGLDIRYVVTSFTGGSTMLRLAGVRMKLQVADFDGWREV